MRYQRGFTLVELIVVIVILGTLAVITGPMLQAGFSSYFTQRNLSDADWQGRLALERIARDIRALSSTNNITTTTSTQFTFVNNANTNVSYTLSGTNLQRNALTLANGINTVTFEYYDSTGAITAVIANIRYITTTLSVTMNNTNLILTTAIDLRNIVS